MSVTTGEYLIQSLEAYGVDTLFGIPGVHTIELYRGLANSPIQHITPRHEQSAGFMADGYARVAGKPGVAFVITGPGLANIATAMLQANADSIPMLVIAGINDIKVSKRNGKPTINRGRLHEMPNQQALGHELAELSLVIESPEQLPEALEQAFTLFASKRPAPVLLQVPVSVMGMDASAVALPDVSAWVQEMQVRSQCQQTKAIESAHTLAKHPDIQQAAQLCVQAKRGVLLLGGGAKLAKRAVLSLAETLDMPIVPTINAKDILPKSYPLAVPASASNACVHHYINSADVVIAIGTEFGATDYDMFATGDGIEPKQLVRIDIDPTQNDAEFEADVFLCGQAQRWVPALTAAIEALTDAVPAVSISGAILAKELNAKALSEQSSRYLHYIHIVHAIRDTLPKANLIGDSTQLIYAANVYADVGCEGAWFNSSVGFGTLGYALPAAMGAKLAKPNETCIAIIGDGGLQFTLPELASMNDAACPVIVLLWNNQAYLEIELSMQQVGIAPEGVVVSGPDVPKLAEAYSLDYHCINAETADQDLPRVLQAWSDANRGGIIEIRDTAPVE